ncbi:hypothetical protein Fcan01_18363 [Folsomia candida]|uniref:Uncharacterized protein n=1 Tax=Folsomia candida TaxID=158441 RepID=A0A226DP03_FOLCA|nr:hypothetical protein Fcan01_18363 [Folsomia candida]
MYQTEFGRFLEYRLKLSNIFNCLPFDFDKNSGRLTKSKSIRQIYIFKLQCVLTVIYAMAMFLHICIGQLTVSGRLQGVAMLLGYVMASIVKWNYSIDIAPIQVVNAFLDFEARIVESK